MFVADVVQAHRLAVQKALNGAFNVGTAIESDVLTLAELLREHMRGHVAHLGSVEMAPARPGEQLRSVIDAALLKDHTGFRPQTLLKDGLAETAAYFRQKREETSPK